MTKNSPPSPKLCTSDKAKYLNEYKGVYVWDQKKAFDELVVRDAPLLSNSRSILFR